MKMSKKQIGELFSLLEDYKSVGKLAFKEEELQLYIDTIDAINALGRDTKSFNGESLSNYEVADIFVDLIQPNSVTLTCGPKETDLLVREKSADVPVMDVPTFNHMATKLYAGFKNSGTTTKVSELRKDVQLLGVFTRQEATIDGAKYTLDGSNPFVPITLSTKFHQDVYFNVSTDIVLAQYWREIFSKAKGNK